MFLSLTDSSFWMSLMGNAAGWQTSTESFLKTNNLGEHRSPLMRPSHCEYKNISKLLWRTWPFFHMILGQLHLCVSCSYSYFILFVWISHKKKKNSQYEAPFLLNKLGCGFALPLSKICSRLMSCVSGSSYPFHFQVLSSAILLDL